MHKIQSASGPLNMRLAQVPKMLTVLRTNWAPMAFFISFKVRHNNTTNKILCSLYNCIRIVYFRYLFPCSISQLETDMDILLKKADMALRKYKMHAVVTNELLTRKEEVTVVTTSGNISVRRDKTKGVTDVESPLIKLLVEMHSAHIEDSSKRARLPE